MKKDTSVELARILGCFIVIGVHICLPMFIDNTFDVGRGYISCLFADGVAVFWFISGFFIFRKFDYKKILTRTIKTIVLPMVIVNVVYFYFSGFILSNESLVESVLHTKDEYMYVISAILSWNNPVVEFGHFWYVWVYMLLMIISPIIYSFIKYLNEDKKRIRLFLLCSLIFLIYNDVSNNNMGEFSHHSVNALVPAMIQMIWGYYLYKNKDYFVSKKWIAGGVIAFFILNIFRLYIQIVRNSKGTEGINIYYWYSAIGLLCAACIIIFCISFTETIIKRNAIKNTINYVSSFTFWIYIMHQSMYYDIFVKFGICEIINKYLINLFADEISFSYEALYTVVWTIVLFGVSLLIMICINMIWRFLKKVSCYALRKNN